MRSSVNYANWQVFTEKCGENTEATLSIAVDKRTMGILTRLFLLNRKAELKAHEDVVTSEIVLGYASST